MATRGPAGERTHNVWASPTFSGCLDSHACVCHAPGPPGNLGAGANAELLAGDQLHWGLVPFLYKKAPPSGAFPGPPPERGVVEVISLFHGLSALQTFPWHGLGLRSGASGGVLSGAARRGEWSQVCVQRERSWLRRPRVLGEGGCALSPGHSLTAAKNDKGPDALSPRTKITSLP